MFKPVQAQIFKLLPRGTEDRKNERKVQTTNPNCHNL